MIPSWKASNYCYTVALKDENGVLVAAQEDVVVTITYTGTATDGSDLHQSTRRHDSPRRYQCDFQFTNTRLMSSRIPDETIILTISTTSDGGFEALEVDENSDESRRLLRAATTARLRWR